MASKMRLCIKTCISSHVYVIFYIVIHVLDVLEGN